MHNLPMSEQWIAEVFFAVAVVALCALAGIGALTVCGWYRLVQLRRGR